MSEEPKTTATLPFTPQEFLAARAKEWEVRMQEPGAPLEEAFRCLDRVELLGRNGPTIQLRAAIEAQRQTFGQINAAVLAEREACAQLAEQLTEDCRVISGWIDSEATNRCSIAAAIRARSLDRAGAKDQESCDKSA